jgi:hypothetical protein
VLNQAFIELAWENMYIFSEYGDIVLSVFSGKGFVFVNVTFLSQEDQLAIAQ